MGVLPLQFLPYENAQTLNLTGKESYTLLLEQLAPQGQLTVRVTDNNQTREFNVRVRIDTPKEMEYYRHGGILHYVLRHLAKAV